MHNNYFIQELGFEFDIQSIPTEVEILRENIGVDAVHCSGEYPAVFFKEVSDFNIETLEKIAEIQRKIWNNSSVVFLYVVSPVEIRIYNCNSKPVFFNTENPETEKELKAREIEICQQSDTDKLSILNQIFSAIAIDSGKIWTSEYSNKIKLQTKVDRYLVSSLLNLARKLRKDLEDDIIHSLLMRSIFVMYLQDRKAIPPEIWDELGEDNFLSVLDDQNTTYKLFAEIENHFNGNVFPVSSYEKQTVRDDHLKLIKQCLIDGDVDQSQQKLFNWRLFDFSFIRIELLSEIYENFLNEFDPVRKKQTGTYYTPPSLVELVLDNVLPKNGNNYKLKVIDLACGSGIFLAQAYKRIVNYWRNNHSEDRLSFKILSDIMKECIFGVEIDPKSIKVAAFSLYLALLDFLDPRDVWLRNGEEFPYLIRNLLSDNKIDKKGRNLFCADTIEENGEFENITFDIIVGNPPFGTKKLPKNVIEYCDKYAYDKQFVIPFIHKAVKLCPEGKIALLFNTKLLTNTKRTAQNFREWLFNDNYVEKVYNLSILRKAPKDFGGHLFSSATVPVSIVCFQKSQPIEPKSTIEYWAPKTFIKSHVAEGVIVDSIDIKYLPREICQQPETKIWKIAQWGTMADYFLINRLERNPTRLLNFIEENNIKNGVGFQFLSEDKTTPRSDKYLEDLPLLQAKSIERYYSGTNNFTSINNGLLTTRKKTQNFYLELYKVNHLNELPKIDKFRRLGATKAYKAPHFFLKKGLTDGYKICASYVDNECCFKDGVYGFYSEEKNEDTLKYLSATYCSDFAHYYLFLTSSSYGIEREQIMKEEYLELPFFEIVEKDYKLISNCFTKIIATNNDLLRDDSLINNFEKEINSHIFSKLNVSIKEVVLIEDLVKYSINLFHKGESSVALKPIASQNPETELYAEMLCDEINDFLKVGDSKVNAKVYKASPHSPLCMVALQFVQPNAVAPPLLVDSKNDFENNLQKINKYTLSEYSQNIYVRKQIRYYDNDTIFIIKPNQKRFWTRSIGIDDAGTIINELIAMDNGE